jgi:nicotinamide-nucleotide amidase
MVKLRLSTRGNNPKMVAELEAEFDMLKQQVADVMVVDEDKTMWQVVADVLLRQGKTLATAESCTGGYIAHLLTSQSGSSRYYLGGAITYDNALKQSITGVQQETLDTHGAVSAETVREMAEGIRNRTGADYALSVSGIMGPDGGSPEKPVGTVWVGIAGKEETSTHQFQFRFDRMRNIELTSNYALNALRRYILG